MTSRFNESSSSNCYIPPEARTNFASRSVQLEEGCPVINEYGTICGETKTLKIFQEFRKIYDDCLQKMECIRDDGSTLKKFAPFKKLVENLWEQNTMLIETVEELEQEATNRVKILQNKLEHCCEKVDQYVQDIESLVEIIRRFREKGVLDSSGLKFNTICDLEIYGYCTDSCNAAEESESKGKNFNENSRGSKPFRRKVSLRDSSTSTKEISMATNTTADLFKNSSSVNDCTMPMGQYNKLNSKLPSKTESKNVKNTKLNENVCLDTRNYHSSIGKNYETAVGMENSDKIKNKTCKTVDKKSATPLIDFHNSMELEECEKSFFNFHSTVNCPDEKNITSKSTNNDSKFTVTSLKSKEKTFDTTACQERTPNGIYTTNHSQSFMLGQNKCKATCFDFGKSININLNLIHESPCCLKSDFSDCDCDCNICGSYSLCDI